MTLPKTFRYPVTGDGKRQQKQRKAVYSKCTNAGLLFVDRCEDTEIETIKKSFWESMNEADRDFPDSLFPYSLLVGEPTPSFSSTEKLHEISSTNGEDKKHRLPDKSTQILTAWFVSHSDHPYPTRNEKLKLSRDSGMSIVQIRNWFTNMRKRHWKPIRKGREPRSYLEIVLLKQLQTNSPSSLN